MSRLAGGLIVILAASAVIQFAAMARMRTEIGQLRGDALTYSAELRRDEIERTAAWLHAWLRTSAGGGRADGLCPAGAPDIETIRAHVFGTYLRERAAGTSETGAREAVMRTLGGQAGR